jgi:RNA polymerase primary sigma factor
MAAQDRARARVDELTEKRAMTTTAKKHTRRERHGGNDSAASCEKTRSELDALALYVQDVETRRRLSRDEEKTVVAEMTEHRDDIVATLRALVLDAAETLALDPDAMRRVRAELADPASERKLEALAQRLQSIATIADRAGGILRLGAGSAGAEALARARRVLAEIAHGFGVAPATLARVAADIAEKHQRIAAAKHRLVEANLRLVLYFARRMKWRGVDTVDLVQEGNIALLRAADTFDPRRGSAFASFACTAIRRAMSRFGSAASRPVHIPSEVRARRQRVRQAERYLTGRDGTPPTWDAIGEYLGVPLSVVVDALDDREEALPLDASTEDDMPILGRLADDTTLDAAEAVEAAQADRQVRDSVAGLDVRDRTVIESRFDLDDSGGATLAELGRALGVTRERARQIEARALQQLRTRGSAGRRDTRRRRRATPRTKQAF